MKTTNTDIKTYLKLIAVVPITILSISCSKNQAENIEAVFSSHQEDPANPTGDSESFVKSQFDINAYPLTKLVCNPFEDEPTPSPKHGIKAMLWFRGLGQPRYYKVMDYVNKTINSEQNLFFNSINVPTRLFSTGFPIETGGTIKNDSGAQLIEYFAMKYESQLTLSDSDEEGTYELALLSDDGTILKIKEPNPNGVLPENWETHINNDGDSPTRMKCASRVLDMKKGKKIPIELFYYQGPRHHISNMLIWRKSTTSGTDGLCNHSGNKLFFDPDKNSKPLAWNSLQARGWKVLESENYLLPDNEIATPVDGDVNYNACYQGDIPVISNYQTVEILTSEVSFSWNTDIPATGLLIVTNLDTGEKITTQTDNLLRTQHSIFVTGLLPSTNYRFQAVSISNTLGRAISSAIELKTF